MPLRSSVFCENLRFSAVSCALQEFPGEGWICKNLRFSAKICVLGSLCHLSSIPLSAPSTITRNSKFKGCICWGGLGHCPREPQRVWAADKHLSQDPRKISLYTACNRPARFSLTGVPLQKLVMKFFPEFSPILLCRAMEFLSWNFAEAWMSQHNKPENFGKNFAPNFAKKLRPKFPPPPKTQTSLKTSLCRNPLLKFTNN